MQHYTNIFIFIRHNKTRDIPCYYLCRLKVKNILCGKRSKGHKAHSLVLSSHKSNYFKTVSHLNPYKWLVKTFVPPLALIRAASLPQMGTLASGGMSITVKRSEEHIEKSELCFFFCLCVLGEEFQYPTGCGLQLFLCQGV